MWELVVFSIGKHSMVLDHQICQAQQGIQFALGIVAVAALRETMDIRVASTGDSKQKDISPSVLNLEEVNSKFSFISSYFFCYEHLSNY